MKIKTGTILAVLGFGLLAYQFYKDCYWTRLKTDLFGEKVRSQPISVLLRGR